MEEIINEVEERMNLTLSALEKDLLQIRTGRATPALLENIYVECYNSKTPLLKLAAVSVPEPRQLLIRPYDVSLVGEIVRAINKSDLGLNPNSDGKRIRLEIPILTEERKKGLIKLINKKGEETKVSLRNIRREVNESVKNSNYPEDEERRIKDKIQKTTDDYIKKVNELIKKKENEIINY